MILEPLIISLMVRRVGSFPSFSSPSFAADAAAFAGVWGIEEVGDEDGKTL